MNGTENQYKGCGNKFYIFSHWLFSESIQIWFHTLEDNGNMTPLYVVHHRFLSPSLLITLYLKRVSLWRHIKYCHINTTPVLCRHCNQGQSALNLKRHEKACKLKVMNNNGDSYMNSNMVKKYPKLSMKHIVRVKKLNPKFLKSLN